MTNIAIPYGAYWSTPFTRWQGSFSHLHSLRFAAHVARNELQRRNIDVGSFDHAALGVSVPQKGSFYGLPWLMGLMGSEQVGGPTISQACATSARLLQSVASSLREGDATVALAIAADRVSNGPHIYYPAPHGPGGTGEHENWVMDNFDCDPYTGVNMLKTAENVAAEYGLTTAQQNELTLVRYQQYEEALKNDSAFLRRFMTLPFSVPDARFKREQSVLQGDEGIFPTTEAGLAKLKPLLDGGTVTFGGQTHPADGNAAIVLTTAERATELSQDPKIDIRLVSFGQSRVKPAFMPAAPAPAARKALQAAGLKASDLSAVKTHNPFIVNDLVLAKELGLDPLTMNRFGCSLVWGHPQAPMGLRAIIELIEQLVITGGGYGLFVGCAAGDSAMAVIIKVDDGT
ncbi:MAG: acetyl-CoA acetyltransferase [Alcaligenaceae bacterium]|nr:acetyl-CoA acetyltransferase [Alcaligenaceae bacterium]MAO50219.1 acetyl-CoA acetyltransferase [Pusillimonas sp.]MBC42052.1 acetyl-CoA acetyltransferase [Pusillimonas sp.]